MPKYSLLIAVLLLGAGVRPPKETPPSHLVGTWQLVSRLDRDSNGHLLTEPSLGTDPKGFLIYDAAGHVTAQLMARTRAAAPCAVTASAEANSPAHISGYEAYFGRYEVDSATGTVTHLVEGALSQSDVGRRLTRRFHIVNDTLTIQFEPGSPGHTRTLVWRRVSP